MGLGHSFRLQNVVVSFTEAAPCMNFQKESLWCILPEPHAQSNLEAAFKAHVFIIELPRCKSRKYSDMIHKFALRLRR